MKCLTSDCSGLTDCFSSSSSDSDSIIMSGGSRVACVGSERVNFNKLSFISETRIKVS